MARHFARSRAWRAGVAVAAATIGATALAGCGGSSSNSSAGGSSELTNETWLVPQDWGSLDPTAVAATNTGAILLVMEPLILANADGTFSRPTYSASAGIRCSPGAVDDVCNGN